jgi:hypothetical protein
MDKTIKYKIIGRRFGMPPIGSVLYWYEPYDCWVVDVNNSIRFGHEVDFFKSGGLKSMWSGNPEEEPELYEPIVEFLPKKNINQHHIIDGRTL